MSALTKQICKMCKKPLRYFSDCTFSTWNLCCAFRRAFFDTQWHVHIFTGPRNVRICKTLDCDVARWLSYFLLLEFSSEDNHISAPTLVDESQPIWGCFAVEAEFFFNCAEDTFFAHSGVEVVKHSSDNGFSLSHHRSDTSLLYMAAVI